MRKIMKFEIPEESAMFEIVLTESCAPLYIATINDVPYIFFDCWADSEYSGTKLFVFESFLDIQEVPDDYAPVDYYIKKINNRDYIFHVFQAPNCY